MKLITMTIAHSQAAHLLPEAIQSAAFADAHLVIDTSPTQPEVASAVVGLNDPTVHLRPWTWRDDFSAARNHMLAQAATLFDGGAEAVWGLTLDTDERFVCNNASDTRAEFAALDPSIAICSAYDTTDFYTKERCFRLPTRARYCGPTHEVPIDTGPQAVLRTWKFWEIGKTTQQLTEKTLRDERLLRKHTKNNPRDPRWWYYLADTLCTLGKAQEAFDAFMRCSNLRGWDEESAWACYRAATIQIQQSKYIEAIDTCAKGVARHPGMAELFWTAAVASCRANMPEKAWYWAALSVAVGSHKGADANAGRLGFRYLPALYELPYDIMRHSAPTEAARGRAEADFWDAKLHRYGGASFEHVALRRGHDGVRWEARNDIGRKLKPIGELIDGVELRQLPNPSTIGYHATNPSICSHYGRTLVSIRTVNYVIDDAGRYVIPDADSGVVKTENFIAEIDLKDVSLSDVHRVADKTGRERHPTLVRGYEDLRLASVGGRLYACATVRDHAADMPCSVAVCEFEAGDIVRDWIQPSARDEKNWMPIVVDDSLCFVYSVEPTIIKRFDSATGMCADTHSSMPTLALDHLRGGSQAVRLPGYDGWLAATHEVVILDDRRRYLHRLIRLDNAMRVISVSRAWTFRDTLGVEFVAGMMSIDDSLVLTAGFDDRQAWLVRLPVAQAVILAGEFKAQAT